MPSDLTMQDVVFGLAMVWVVLVFYTFFFNKRK